MSPPLQTLASALAGLRRLRPVLSALRASLAPLARCAFHLRRLTLDLRGQTPTSLVQAPTLALVVLGGWALAFGGECWATEGGAHSEAGRTSEAGATSCVVLGDSIAKGVAAHRPECRARARVGVGSVRFLTDIMARSSSPLPAFVEQAVISLGSNDDARTPEATERALERIREEAHARLVIWILPGIKPPLQAAVKRLAARHGDRLVTFEIGADGIHPSAAEYARLARATR